MAHRRNNAREGVAAATSPATLSAALAPVVVVEPRGAGRDGGWRTEVQRRVHEAVELPRTLQRSAAVQGDVPAAREVHDTGTKQRLPHLKSRAAHTQSGTSRVPIQTTK